MCKFCYVFSYYRAANSDAILSIVSMCNYWNNICRAHTHARACTRTLLEVADGPCKYRNYGRDIITALLQLSQRY